MLQATTCVRRLQYMTGNWLYVTLSNGFNFPAAGLHLYFAHDIGVRHETWPIRLATAANRY